MAAKGDMRMIRTITALKDDRRAGVAMSFAIMLPLLMSGMALAMDYSSFRLTQTRMQTAVDAAALAAIDDVSANTTTKTATAISLVRQNVPESFGDVTRDTDVTIGRYDKETGFVPGVSAASNAAMPLVGFFRFFFRTTP